MAPQNYLHHQEAACVWRIFPVLPSHITRFTYHIFQRWIQNPSLEPCPAFIKRWRQCPSACNRVGLMAGHPTEEDGGEAVGLQGSPASQPRPLAHELSCCEETSACSVRVSTWPGSESQDQRHASQRACPRPHPTAQAAVPDLILPAEASRGHDRDSEDDVMG